MNNSYLDEVWELCCCVCSRGSHPGCFCFAVCSRFFVKLAIHDDDGDLMRRRIDFDFLALATGNACCCLMAAGNYQQLPLHDFHIGRFVYRPCG